MKELKFSQRIGKTTSVKNIQLEYIDTDLKNGLWNLIKMLVLDKISKSHNYNEDSEFDEFNKILYHNFYKLPIDIIPEYDYQKEKIIRDSFFNAEWFEVYDFMEFLTRLEFNSVIIQDYINAVNNLLEKEFSGYRFVDGVIAPITNKIEVQEIEKTISLMHNFTSLNSANIHLNKALDKISDRKKPDYRNSIKESISSVETTCRILTGESTLGKALNTFEKKGILIDDQLKSGFEKIYAYTNNKESGIRHAIIEDHKEPDFSDAKYMLVACSSFINYLIGKCLSLGIKLK